jgi:hypothetical protein
MIIMGFNQLQAILASIQEEPTEELKRELAKWLRYKSDLNMHNISLFDPTLAAKDKAGTTLGQIREYQALDEKEFEEAINQLK